MGQNPPIDVPPLDPNTKCFTPDWYDRLQYLNLLQPLSDIVFPDPGHDDTKSNVLRNINTQSGTSHTFASSEVGDYFRFTSSSAISATVPSNTSDPIPVGAQFDGVRAGTGKLTFVAGSGVTINSAAGNLSIGDQWVGWTLIKVDTDEWDLIGTLAP